MSSKPKADPADSAMPLMAHLVELRNRLFKVAVAVAVGAIVGWMLFDPVFNVLTHPIVGLCKHHQCLLEGGKVQNLDPLDPLTTRLKLSVYIGVAIAMPVVLWQLWRFIAPALYANERKYTLAFIGPALVLFLGGATLAYFVLPVSLNWLQGVGGPKFVAAYDSGKFVSLIGWMMLAFGLSFEFPIVMVAMMAMGILKPRTLVKGWRYAIAIIIVFAGVITPTADPFTFMFMAIPMVALFWGAVLAGILMERARGRRGGA